MTKYRRYFTKESQRLGAVGKGSHRREQRVTDQQYAENFCETFGHRVPSGSHYCVSCGKSDYQIEKEALPF